MPAQVIDLFCGVGGLTRGLLNVGLDVIRGYDIDPTCQYAYEHNNNIDYDISDVRELNGDALNAYYDDDVTKILVGCAPCQPFSQMRFKLGERNRNDDKYNLLTEYGRLIGEITPEIISMENVPQIRNTNVYDDFLNVLQQNGYHYSEKIIYCPDYGIPQSRRRFVLIASTLGDIDIIEPTHINNRVTVRQFIGDMPQIAAGQTDANDPLHRSSALNEKNLRRIQASVPGGTWRDWDEDLRCECHKKTSGRTYGSVYGRMSWDAIGPTITTQFYNYGTGRFGHPEQDRALSLREGALLQTFPVDYDFINPDVRFVLSDVARHIGNAVPVRLGEVIGESIINHLEENDIEL